MITIAFDTNIIIYWLEKNPEFSDAAQRLIKPIVEQKERGVISVMLCTEFVAGTKRAELLRPLFLLPNLQVVGVTHEIAMIAGELCSTHGIKPMDAVHIATALESGATKFITNDKQLIKLAVIDSLKIIPLL